jgi:hypothetical protein
VDKVQAAAAKMGDPLLNMMSNASKKLQDYLDNYKQTRAKDTASVATTGGKEAAGVALETKWEQWQKVFAEAEEQESLATVLRVLLHLHLESLLVAISFSQNWSFCSTFGCLGLMVKLYTFHGCWGLCLFCEQFQMEEAAAIEDFQEAARLKGALDAVTATDTVAEVMVELKVCSCPQLSCLGTMCQEFKSEPYLGA